MTRSNDKAVHDAEETRLFLTPRLFADQGVVAGFSTRRGGHSAAPYDSLNVGLSTADDSAVVRANRAVLFQSAHVDPARVAIAGQVHGTDVLFVSKPGLYEGVDALVTRTEGLALAITAADCAVVILADAEGGVAGAAHAGWRGTVGGIVSETVSGMVERGACVERMLAYVSPCISSERFEVGEEVARQFPPDVVVRRAEWKRPHVDLRRAIVLQLGATGLRAAHIEASSDCTYEHPDYFSYRAESGMTGRMMGFVMLHRRPA